MRGIRQNILLSDQLNRLNSFLIFSVGNVLNICLPLRFGDFWRAYNIGKELDISKLQILGIITVERLMDSFSVIIVFGFALIKYMQNQVAVIYIAEQPTAKPSVMLRSKKHKRIKYFLNKTCRHNFRVAFIKNCSS